MNAADRLSLARLWAAPAVAVLIVADPGAAAQGSALVVFALAAATDWADGRVARARGEVSLLGAWLDTIADKALVLATLVALCAVDVVEGAHGLAVAAIVLREVLITGLRGLLATDAPSAGHDDRPLATTRAAKWKAGFQFGAAAVLLASSGSLLAWPWLRDAGLALLWLAAALSLLSGWGYWRSARAGLAGLR